MADSLSNAALAQQISTLVSAWTAREAEFKNWVGGLANGGANGDGRYPLTDYLGTSTLVSCPAAIMSSVSGPAVAAGLSATAADQSATAAHQSELNAAASASSASTAVAAVQAAATGAVNARNLAQTAANNALSYKDSAQTSATAASASQSAASASATAADGSKSAAASSASAAAASAAAAATFNPSLYLLKTGGVLTGSTRVASTGNNSVELTLDGAIEITRAGSGAYIDLKTTLAQDYEVRLQANGTVLDILAAGFRYNNNTVWHAGNLTPSNYLPVAGGSMTGTLTVSQLKSDNIFFPSSGTAETMMYRHATGGWTISVNRQVPGSEHYLSFSADGSLKLDGGNVWHAGNFIPGNYLPLTGGTLSGHLTLPVGGNILTVGSPALFYLPSSGGEEAIIRSAASLAGRLTLQTSDGVVRGSFYANKTNQVGLLNSAGGWRLICNTERFYRNTDAGVTYGLWDEGNFTPSSYLPLTGGTLTGSLQLASAWGWNGFQSGTGDGASWTTYNTSMKIWWGLGMMTYDGSINGYYDARQGLWNVKGGYQVNGNAVWHAGTLTPLDRNTGGTMIGPLTLAGDPSGSLQAATKQYVDNGLSGKQASLGFTPVRQGGGSGQTNNTVFIGWTASGKLGLQIDVTSFGTNWPLDIQGNAGTVTSITSTQVTSALGYTPANGSNYLPLTGGTIAGNLNVTGALSVQGKALAYRLDGRSSSGITFSTAAPSGGSDGDLWFTYT
ncbi:hypothetical protein EOE18_15330 [Novosphingobium umbonatum]|uniref:Uncharacterized protein n=1 Tax=Novosphingobium umbonatum TaxID=1908524 RepID=A0A3S2VBD6_9SPHN|nr:hypothetical protein [Novosphingobium umbonatum]RVU03493.1 hypothetical protein EOE18_15330 [Novosphingobium umbonatum]